ncbi:MAG: fumarylacetoacetate hydrolase family protein [Alphaproteobacteria bacterium]|nr:fumarylacetoacetate hydrolase family protein [Alphaproteobacteria bacterium]
MRTVIQAAPQTTLEVAGTADRFPIARIYCIGRNYAAHAREMGHDPDREAPFFFMKPADAILPSGEDFPYPPQSENVHHEIELVVALSRGGKDIAEADAMDHIYGYGVGIDMTRRDLQGQAKKLGRPWDVGKGFDKSAPCTKIHPVSEIGHPPGSASIWLEVNGETKQKSELDKLIWSIPEMIAILSQYFELQPGDLIFTGTPAGVGPVQKGDKIRGGVDGVDVLETSVI